VHCNEKTESIWHVTDEPAAATNSIYMLRIECMHIESNKVALTTQTNV
jgi:hypothetical protein